MSILEMLRSLRTARRRPSAAPGSALTGERSRNADVPMLDLHRPMVGATRTAWPPSRRADEEWDAWDSWADELSARPLTRG